MDTFAHSSSRVVAHEGENIRISFYRKTFLHLAGSIVIFAALSAAILTTPLGALIAGLFFGGTIQSLIFFGLYVGVSYLAQSWARNSASKAIQYAGLGLYIIIEALIFAPLLLGAQAIAGLSLIGYAGVLTLTLAAGLIVLTMINQIDFSFLNGFLFIGGIVVFGAIIGSIIFGYTLGVWFSAAMIGFAAFAILRDASAVQRNYRSDQYVAASLSLFASIALLFYYILRFMMSFSRD